MYLNLYMCLCMHFFFYVSQVFYIQGAEFGMVFEPCDHEKAASIFVARSKNFSVCFY